MNAASLTANSIPLVVATVLREEGRTGVHTQARQLRRYLAECGSPAAIITLRSFLLGLHPGRAAARADTWKAGRR